MALACPKSTELMAIIRIITSQNIKELGKLVRSPWQPSTIYQSPASKGVGTRTVSALHLAVEESWIEGVDVLLQAGANVDSVSSTVSRMMLRMHFQSQTSSNNMTPLMIACIKGHFEIARLLVEHKANVNAQDPKTGNMPLSLALISGCVQCVKLLLDNGGSVITSPLQLSTTAGWRIHSLYHTYSPLNAAIRRYNHAKKKEQSSKLDNSEQLSKEWLLIIKQMISLGADISWSGWGSETTPLIESVEGEGTEVVEYLLNCGVAVDKQSHVYLCSDPPVNTALTLAIFMNKPQTVSLLLDRKAEVASISDEILHYAINQEFMGVLCVLASAHLNFSKSTLELFIKKICPGLRDTNTNDMVRCKRDCEAHAFVEFVQSPRPLSLWCRKKVLSLITHHSHAKNTAGTSLRQYLPPILADYILVGHFT